jgi:hypothetical protein
LNQDSKDTKQADDDALASNPGIARTVTIHPDIGLKSYRERMAWLTVTSESMWPHFYQPIVTLFTFPAVAYAALTYGSTLAWFAIMTSLQASYMLYPPYNFNAIGVGLMNVAPFVGAMLGFPVGGWLSDKSILWLSKKNGGIYEPEMRLWLALPCAILIPGSILMFGLGLAHVRIPIPLSLILQRANISQGVQWSLLAVGYGLFGFAFSAISGIALSYLMDCYQDVRTFLHERLLSSSILILSCRSSVTL